MDSERINDNHTTSSWNAVRLVKEYTKVAWMANDTIAFEDIPLANQIRLQRVASVICAYLNKSYDKKDTLEIINSVFDCYSNKCILEKSDISDENMSKLKQMLCSCSKEGWRIEHLLKRFEIKTDRKQLMRMLIRYRIAAEDLLGTFSGVMEAHVGAYIGIQTVRSIYDPVLEECNDKIDAMIVILLGDKFDRIFMEKELIEDFNYPTMTDTELLDWEIDNF